MSRPKRSPGLRGLLESALREQERALEILDEGDNGLGAVKRHIATANHELRNALAGMPTEEPKP